MTTTHPSRVTTDAQRARAALVLSTALVVLLVLMSLSMKGAFQDRAYVSATFDTVGGAVVAGTDVKVRGLVVGAVDQVAPATAGTRLDLSIDSTALRDIPKDVRARVVPASSFGTTFVELVSAQSIRGDIPADSRLRDGQRISQDKSQPTLELQQSLDDIDRLVKALGPAELARLLGSLAMALDGHGADYGQAASHLNHLLKGLNPEMPQLREDLGLLATNLRTLETAAPDLLDSFDDSVVVAGHLVQHRLDFARLLVGGRALSDDLDELLRTTSGRYTRALSDTATIFDALYDYRDGLRRGYFATNTAAERLPTVSDGGRVRIDARLANAAFYRYYTAADCPRYGDRQGGNCDRRDVNRFSGGAFLDGDRR